MGVIPAPADTARSTEVVVLNSEEAEVIIPDSEDTVVSESALSTCSDVTRVPASPQPSGGEWHGHDANLALNEASSGGVSEFQPSQELLSSAYNSATADHTPSQEVEDRDEEATALYNTDTGSLEDDDEDAAAGAGEETALYNVDTGALEDDEEDAAAGADEEPVPSKDTDQGGDLDIDLPPLRFEPPPHRSGSPLHRLQKSPSATPSPVRGHGLRSTEARSVTKLIKAVREDVNEDFLSDSSDIF
ncbi:hypothetical protein N0V94_000773 [Neodidymelliopsis sp. IMI 364377]|nr:hypothetical protein N0V94_000773 [Neodidymelliopsis sp. IMI 364377]